MNSRKLSAIVRKEMTHYFSSAVGYIVLFVYFVIGGFFYFKITTGWREASMRQIFGTLTFILLFLTPFVTMRIWSEEEKNSTSELLVTSPLTIWEIVVGKYLAICCFFAVMSIPTLLYLSIILATGNPDLLPVLANYLGYGLAAAAFFSLGILTSTLSENQIVSAAVAFGLNLMLWMIGWAGENAEGKMGDFLKGLSIFNHTDDFFKGIIDLSHVFYFASLIFVGLFFAVKVLESKRS